jgi:hypothetical protein
MISSTSTAFPTFDNRQHSRHPFLAYQYSAPSSNSNGHSLSSWT